MTPAQALKKIPAAVPPPRQEPQSRDQLFSPHREATGSLVDDRHILRIVAPPAQGGERIKQSEVEPWMLEQLEKGNCPTCMDHCFHMQSKYALDKHFYVCEAEPVRHRWTIVED